jgi:hypothetical protein
MDMSIISASFGLGIFFVIMAANAIDTCLYPDKPEDGPQEPPDKGTRAINWQELLPVTVRMRVR